jgi:hypothetical protein
MQIEMREEKVWRHPRETRESRAPNRREEELLKTQMWCGEGDLGDWKREIGWKRRRKES